MVYNTMHMIQVIQINRTKDKGNKKETNVAMMM